MVIHLRVGIKIWFNNVFSFSNTIITEDIIYMRNGNLLNKFMFEENGGTEVAAIGVNHGNKINPPETPIKVGYTFKGWFINEDYKWRI